MDALIVLLVMIAALLVLDALAVFLGQDSRSVDGDDWARPWSSTRPSETEC